MTKRVTLPALQRAIRNNLTVNDQDNGAAAVTLARLHRTLAAGETDDGDVATWDFETQPDPIVDGRLDMDMPPERLARLDEAAFRVVWSGDRLQAEIFAKDRWRPLVEKWSLRPANDNIRASSPKPKMLATRRELSPLDAEDRALFETLVGEDDMIDVEMVAAGTTMREIGQAAGFSGKQAEAVGLDRTRRAVTVAQRAFRTVGHLTASAHWWRGLDDSDLVPGHLVKRRLAA